MTGCATKPPVKHPAKPFEKPVIRQVNYNYACPVSNMDDFHKNLHSKSESGFAHWTQNRSNSMNLTNLRNHVVRAVQKLLHRRSPKWARVRAKHLRNQPWCQLCGGLNFLEVHHIVPFHIQPEKELDHNNLITLCDERGYLCHLKRGHLGDWRKANPNIAAEAKHVRGR